MDILKFFIGAFFLMLNIIIFDGAERTREVQTGIVLLSILNAFIAGGFLAGARDRGRDKNRLLSGFSGYRKAWSIGGERPEISNAGGMFLISLCIIALYSNFL